MSLSMYHFYTLCKYDVATVIRPLVWILAHKLAALSLLDT